MSQQQSKTVVVVGEKGVGKSAVVHRLTDSEEFDFSTYRPTIDDCYNVVWKLPADGKYVQIQLIDTAAWNEFPAMQSLYIKMSHLVIVVYDVVSPDWRNSLLTVINGVRSIKDDADIFVVGNKCDKLTVTNYFTPSDLSHVIGHSCVGHVYASALTQQGIAGMKQLILCSKSQLTEGHYAEFSSVHKKKKLKKKLNGLALALKFTRKQKDKEDKTDSAPKYREPIVYPQQPNYVAYSDLSGNNFDKLFNAAESGRDKHHGDHKKSSHHDKHRRRQSAAIDAGFVSDYSSPGTSPSSSNYGSMPTYRGHRKSMDFSYMMEPSSSPHISLHRRRSSSTGNDAGYKKKINAAPSISTIMSDSSSDSNSYETNSDGKSSHQKVLEVERVRMRKKSPTHSKQRLHRSSGLSVSSTESLDENLRPVSQTAIRGTLSNPERCKGLSPHHDPMISLSNGLSSLHVNGQSPSRHEGERQGERRSPARHIRHRSDGKVIC